MVGEGGDRPAKLSHPLRKMGPMNEQLHLIDPSEISWRLDEQTKSVGRQGIARARAALAAARIPAEPARHAALADHRHAA